MNTKFNSQICTTREQSERLLSLGLKRETADMIYIPKYNYDFTEFIGYYHPQVIFSEYCQKPERYNNLYIPAWSLHRLIEIVNETRAFRNWLGADIVRDYDHLIDIIKIYIEEGIINKEHLV